MGNGHNRNRRGGARTRHGPHRGGAGSGDRRSATQLVPPTLAASADTGAEADDTAELAAASELDDTSALDTEDESASDVTVEPAEPAQATQPLVDVADETPTLDEAPEMERRPTRGRFERFYAPGQGARAEQSAPAAPGSPPGAAATGASHGGPHGAPHSPHGVVRYPTPTPLPSPAAQTPQAPQAAHADDDDEDTQATPSGPRADVRGAVGELIDSLHELFAQDRTIASQGGSARCGICYLHYPLGELVYREAEGFYVCAACDRALGAARVGMVRRQQRQ